MKFLQKMFLPVCLLALFVVIPVPGELFAAEETTITISLPARALHEVISDALPIPLESNQLVDGDIMIESLDKLQVKDNSIFLQGTVKGENLSMNTKIAEKNISMKLGTVTLPVSCELFMRFDKTGKTLFVTPRFSKTGKDGGGSELGDLLLPALTAFADREYPVELDSLEPLLVRVGTRDIPINLDVVDIQAKQGLMVIKLKPRESKVQ